MCMINDINNKNADNGYPAFAMFVLKEAASKKHMAIAMIDNAPSTLAAPAYLVKCSEIKYRKYSLACDAVKPCA